MSKLQSDTRATQVQPETGQELVDAILPAGTEFNSLGNPYYAVDHRGKACWQRLVLVDGYLYRVRDADLSGLD